MTAHIQVVTSPTKKERREFADVGPDYRPNMLLMTFDRERKTEKRQKTKKIFQKGDIYFIPKIIGY